MNTETFPIDLRALEKLSLDPLVSRLSEAQRTSLEHNIQLCRDTIVFFIALAGARGLSGHPGGASCPLQFPAPLSADDQRVRFVVAKQAAKIDKHLQDSRTVVSP
jgi:hypothetical protein